MNNPGFGVYVHWPFCTAKCPYCDFNSHVRAQFDDGDWSDSITRELDTIAEWQGDDRPIVRSIFFGGGTPSLMSGKATAAVIDRIARNWRMANDVEITLEANPASADAERFADYRTAGVNRVSLGVQALNDADLKMLGRLHNTAEAKAALALAMKTFDRVSLDLIYARPEQTPEQWCAELQEALSFGTEHLSLYQLTIEPETPFAVLARTGKLITLDDDRSATLYEITQEMTEAAGRPAYEISNHAIPGGECRHNLIYWRYGAYAGVGPGAHGRLDVGGDRVTTETERLPERWLARVREHGHGIVSRETIPPRDAAREHLLMNLRLSEGVDLAGYRERWNTEPNRERVAALRRDGFLELDKDCLSASPKGRLLLNRLIAEIAD